MKLGQAVEIESVADAEPVTLRGHVTSVSRDEIVVDLEDPDRLTLSPQSSLRVSYRDPRGEHHVPARVLGSDNQGRLVLAPGTGEPAPADRRRGVRIEHLLRMDYQVIQPDEMDEIRQEVLHGPHIIKYDRQQPTPPAVVGIENEPLDSAWETSPIAERLQRIELKLDALLERLGVDAPTVHQKPLYNVSLSAAGLRFRDFQRRCQAGDMVYVIIELPLNPTVEVQAIAETLYVVEDARPNNLSTGHDVVLEFRAIRDEVRGQIDRYCQQYHALRRTA